jgi:hypothetical protein
MYESSSSSFVKIFSLACRFYHDLRVSDLLETIETSYFSIACSSFFVQSIKDTSILLILSHLVSSSSVYYVVFLEIGFKINLYSCHEEQMNSTVDTCLVRPFIRRKCFHVQIPHAS